MVSSKQVCCRVLTTKTLVEYATFDHDLTCFYDSYSQLTFAMSNHSKALIDYLYSVLQHYAQDPCCVYYDFWDNSY